MLRAFVEQRGRNPDGVWSAPGRVNLIGEHTDYNGGYVLPFALDLPVFVAAAKRSDGILTAASLQQPEHRWQTTVGELAPGERHSWATYAFGVVWALRRAGHDIGGCDIVLHGTVPSGAGLSSSAAIECAVGLAAADLYGIEMPRETLARLAQQAENDYVGVPCGLLDQMAASVCRPGHALFFDVREDRYEHVPFAPSDEGLALVVINTRVRHSHADGSYAARRRACEEAAERLGVSLLRDISVEGLDDALAALDDDTLRRRTRHVVTENERVLETVRLLRAGRLADIGPLLIASHVSLRDDFEVSCAELDVAVDAALASGALGARMTGGGFGGSAIALVPLDAVTELRSAVESAFASHDFARRPQFLPSMSAGGATRLAISSIGSINAG